MKEAHFRGVICLSLAMFLVNSIGISLAKDDLDKLSDSDKLKYLTDIISLPEMEVWGTEYSIGEAGKIWLQLLDDNREPIENSTCFITTWFPNNTLLFNQSPMNYLDEGIFYKNFIVPDEYGVYPETALCSIPRLEANYSLINYTTIAYDDLETGDGSGGTGFISDWGFDTSGYCSVTSGGYPIDNYHIRCIGYDGKSFRLSEPSISGLANITFWAKFDSLEAGEYYNFDVYNNTLGDWVNYRTWDNTNADNIYHEYMFSIEGCESGILIRFRADTGGGADYGSFDNITISQPTIYNYYEVNETQYEYVFGSGEIHVSEPLSNLNTNLSLDISRILNYVVAYNSENLVSNHDYCLDNNTLVKVLTYEQLIGTDLFTYQRNETINCPYGCFKYFNTAESQGYCSPSPLEKYGLLIGLIVFAFIVLILGFYVEF